MIRHICIFSAFFPPHTGGVERYVHDLSLELKKIGHEITIVTSDLEGDGVREDYRGIEIIRLPVRKLLGGRYPLPGSSKLKKNITRILREQQTDACIMNMRIYPHSLLGANIAKKLGCKSVLIEHVSGYFSLGNAIKNNAAKAYEHFVTARLKNRVDRFYGVSKACSAWLGNFGISSSGEIHNGIGSDHESENIDVRKEYNIPEKSFVIAFAGRLIPEKGIDYLCRAVEFLRESDESVYLILAGDGPMLEKLNNKYRNNAGIKLTGQISHARVMAILEQASLCLIPSFYPEGLPTLILEAGAAGCPVVSTPMGGAKEILDSPEYGIIIEPRSVESIVGAIISLKSDENRRLRIAEKLRQKILENYTWEKIAANLSAELEKTDEK